MSPSAVPNRLVVGISPWGPISPVTDMCGCSRSPPHAAQLDVVDIAGMVSASRPPGSRRESHPPAPTDPHVSLSTHTARAVQLAGRSAAVAPMHEQLGIPLIGPPRATPMLDATALQSLVLPPRPAHQMAVDALTEWDHRARIERGEVAEPTPQHEVDPGCEVVGGQGSCADEAARLRLGGSSPSACSGATAGRKPVKATCVRLLYAFRGRNV